MKKLAIALAAFGALAVATPVFACPHGDKDKSSDTGAKTAEKTKDQEKKAPAKKAPAKDKKESDKKDDKVTMK